MIDLYLRYAGSAIPITGILDEHFKTNIKTIRGLLSELDVKYGGFNEMFIDRQTGEMNFSVMIYYSGAGQAPIPVIDLDQPVENNSIITFW